MLACTWAAAMLSGATAACNDPWCLSVPPGEGVAVSATAASVVRLSPADDLLATVKSSPAGSTFLFAPGVYREAEIKPRTGDTFVGASEDPGGVVLTGARIIGGAPMI